MAAVSTTGGSWRHNYTGMVAVSSAMTSTAGKIRSSTMTSTAGRIRSPAMASATGRDSSATMASTATRGIDTATVASTMVATAGRIIGRIMVGIMRWIIRWIHWIEILRMPGSVMRILEESMIPVGIEERSFQAEVKDRGVPDGIFDGQLVQRYKNLFLTGNVAIFTDDNFDDSARNAVILGHIVIHEDREDLSGGCSQFLFGIINADLRASGRGLDLKCSIYVIIGTEQANADGQPDQGQYLQFHDKLLGVMISLQLLPGCLKNLQFNYASHL